MSGHIWNHHPQEDPDHSANPTGGQDIQPTDKSPQVEAMLTHISGKNRRDVILSGGCMTCDSIGNNLTSKFKDESSRREYGISGMCQACQDQVFG